MKYEDHIGFQVRELCNLIDRVLFLNNLESGADKITASHGWMIGYLYHNRDRDIYQKTMEQDFHMPKSTVTSIVQAMERSGYITRTGVAHDARLKKIVLSEAGIQFYHASRQFIREVEEQLCMDIPEADRQAFCRIIAKMQENLAHGFSKAKGACPKQKEMKKQEESTC